MTITNTEDYERRLAEEEERLAQEERDKRRDQAAGTVSAEMAEERLRTRTPEEWQAELAPHGYTVVEVAWPGCPVPDHAVSMPYLRVDGVRSAHPFPGEDGGPVHPVRVAGGSAVRYVPVIVRTPWRLTDAGIVYEGSEQIQYGSRRTTPESYLVCSPVFQVGRGCFDRHKRYHDDGRVTTGAKNQPSRYALGKAGKWKVVEVPPGAGPLQNSNVLHRALADGGLKLNDRPLLIEEIGPGGLRHRDERSAFDLLCRFITEHETQVGM